MRISTKLSAVVVAVFLLVGAAGVVALVRLHAIAEQTIESEARNVAQSMANLAAFEITHSKDANLGASFQQIIDYLAEREKRDLEVVAPDLTILADVSREQVGAKVEQGGRRAIIGQTLKDGHARLMMEAAGGRVELQVVVPIRDDKQRIIAALVFEYTPLSEEINAQAARSVQVVGILALLGIALVLACAFYLSRVVTVPLARLTDAVAQLARGRRSVAELDGSDEMRELAGAFNAMSTALHLRERAMASTFNGIMIADLRQPGYPLDYVNEAFERITGYSAQEAVGQPSNFLAGDETDQPGLQELNLALRERREAHAILRCYRKNGELFWNEVNIAPVRSDDGDVTHFIAVFADITDARNDAEQLARQAQYDTLTGLANRSLLLDRLEQAIGGAQRHHDGIVVAFIDLDDFKIVNDNLGHEAGDTLLQEVARRLQSCVRPSDTVARFGGDEFVLLLIDQGGGQDATAESALSEMVRRVLEEVGATFHIGGHDIKPGCSIGLAAFPQDGDDAETLIKHADTAMYRAKELGRNNFQFFTAALQARAQQQLELGASLRRALEREEFELHYQPQVSLRSGRVAGIEALLRWRHPEKGLLGPGHFIGFAEETGLIIPIGAWVLREACRQNKAWQDAGLPAIPIAVNVSARQCAQQDLEAVVRAALEASGLEPRYLELELTESISMADPEKSVPMMERMKAIGVELSIDDFGTGYSNMSYLKRFPIDRLKLDISFVREITTDPGSLAISDAIITMSHSLHLEVVAEGVETEGQLALLATRHCDIVQGYYFSKPLAAGDLADLLREDRRLPDRLTGRTPDAPALLVLDDDHHLLSYIDLVLSSEGYTVHATSDPEAAFEILACNEVAVVLCDQRMPAMSGSEFLGRIRHLHPQVWRIMLSAFDDAEATRQAINMGAVYKYVEKPLQPEELVSIVEEAYRRYIGARTQQQA